jgi:FixJ family two-component response regulator
VPIIVISADGNPQKAASVGARGFLAKPFDIQALLDHVSAAAA